MYRREESAAAKCAAALPALTLAVVCGARRRDASPALACAQAGLLELLANSTFYDPHRPLMAARCCMMVHAMVDCSWRDERRDGGLVLALAAPPGGRSLGKLTQLLDACAQQPGVLEGASSSGPLVNGAILAMGSLCGAARPFGKPEHATEHTCKRDCAGSLGVALALGAGLSKDAPRERKRGACRLLAALLREDSDEASVDADRLASKGWRPIDHFGFDRWVF